MYINQNLLIKYILPVDKRTDAQIAWLESLLDPMIRLNNFDNDYQNGSSYVLYDALTTYNIGDVVNGGATEVYAIYESQADSNIGNSLSDTTYWLKVNDYPVGVNERAHFTGNKIVFEYGLNRYFQTTFRQPTGVTSSALRSDIYIEDTNIIIPSFIVGNIGNSSDVFNNTSSGFIVDGTFFYATYQYNIYVPNTLLSVLPSGSNNIRNVADRYNYFGINYDVIGY